MSDTLTTIIVDNKPSFKTLEDGRTEISFIADKLHSWEIPKLRETITNANADKLTVKVSKFRKKRSLDANAYLWSLCQKLAEKLNIPKEEIYRHHIKDIGVCRMVEIDEKAADTLIYSWSLHGIGWVSEKLDHSEHEGFVLISLYYGSSTYNTKQMSRLIDAVVQDCKDQEIETLTPDELQALKEAWKSERKS